MGPVRAGQVRLASSTRDLADLSSLSFGLELVLEPPTRLFLPARGVALAAGNGPGNEAALPYADAAAAEIHPQLAGADMAAILVAITAQGQQSLL